MFPSSAIALFRRNLLGAVRAVGGSEGDARAAWDPRGGRPPAARASVGDIPYKIS